MDDRRLCVDGRTTIPAEAVFERDREQVRLKYNARRIWKRMRTNRILWSHALDDKSDGVCKPYRVVRGVGYTR
jgi:hypothetical protein